MSEEDKQAVTTGTDADATPSGEESGAQEPTVDELLSEFEADEPKTELKDEKQSTSKQEDTGVNLTVDQRKQIMDDLRSEMKVDDEINAAVVDIKGDLDVEEEYVRWKLEELAKNDTRVWKAFLARNSNPKAWNAITKKLQEEFTDKFSKPVIDDKEKIASAVHSATQRSGSTADDVNIKQMSDVDFEMQKPGILKKAMAGR